MRHDGSRHVPTGWSKYPNLRLRPHAPAKGRGRLQTQVRRAFTAAIRNTLSSSEVYDFAYAAARRIHQRQRHSVYRVLMLLCDRVGRDRAHGAIIWRLKNGIDYGHKPQKLE